MGQTAATTPMTDTLFPYQQDGAEFLAARRLALLADEMGLGKSAQAVRGCDLVHAKRILVVCPAAACVNWTREFDEFSIEPREFTIIDGRAHDVAALADDSRSFVLSYDLARYVAPLLSGRFDVLIIDECHFLKSLETQRTKAVLGRGGLVRQASRIWALSGTPAPNHYGELYPLLLTFGLYRGDYDSFVDKFCRTAPGRHPHAAPRIVGSKEASAPELRKLLAPAMLRRRKDEVMKQLPSITFKTLYVKAAPVALDMYESFMPYFLPTNRADELLEKLTLERDAVQGVMRAAEEAATSSAGAFGILPPTALESLGAMAKSVSTLRRFTALQKVEPVARLLIDELERNEYEKIVVFAIHQDVIEGLRARLAANPLYRAEGFTKNYHPVTLYGGTPPEKRQKHIDAFQRDNKTRVFIGNIQAAGTAITLTRAHNALFLEQSWVPGDNAQAAMRVHRIGQTKPVTVRFAVVEGSFDEKVGNALRRKAAELQKIFDAQRENEFTKTNAVSKTDTHDLNADSFGDGGRGAAVDEGRDGFKSGGNNV